MNDERDPQRRRPSPERRPQVRPGSGSGQPGLDATPEHVDLRQLHFDDAFLDALSRDVPTPTRDSTDYELAELLSGWRHDALSQPAPAVPDITEVERAMAAANPARRGARVVRSLRIVAAAAAIVVVAAAGLTVVSERAQPGDSLWSVKKVVFAQAASETQAAYDVRSDLEQAEAALAAGQRQRAQELIARAESQLGPVRDSGTRGQMNDWIERLRADEQGATRPATRTPTTRPHNPDLTAASPTDSGTTATEPSSPSSSTTPSTTTVPSSTTSSPVPTSATPTSPETTTPTPRR